MFISLLMCVCRTIIIGYLFTYSTSKPANPSHSCLVF